MRKQIFSAVITLLFIAQVQLSFGQTTIAMEKNGGVFSVPCSVNGLKLKFIFDTGASDVCISLTEAVFMLKNDYLKESDIIGSSYAQLANGEVTKNTKILIREIVFEGLIINNVSALVVHNLGAPLLLGQSAMAKLGKFQFDPNEGILTIISTANNSSNSNTYTYANKTQDKITSQTFVTTRFKTKLMKTPKDILETEVDEIYLPYDLKLTVLGIENGYYKVQYNNIVGYLNSIVAN